MSLNGGVKMVCNKLSKTFDNLVKPLEKSKKDINKLLNKANSKFDKLGSFSGSSVIDDAINDIFNEIENSLPDINTGSYDDIFDFIKNCTFLNSDSLFDNPFSLLSNCENSALDSFRDYLNGLIPEFGIGNLFGDITDLLSFGGANISGNMFNLDKIINCISSSCGGDFSSKLSDMVDVTNNLYSGMNLISDPASLSYGLLDLNSIYSNFGMNSTEISGMTKIVTSIADNKTKIKSRIGTAKIIAKSFF